MTVQLTTIIPSIFNQIRPGATMLAVRGYQNNYDEISDFSIVFHVNYLNAVKRSLDIMKAYRVKSILEEVARRELMESYEETLSGKGNSRDTNSHAYTGIVDGQVEIIPGVRWHPKKARIYMWGFRVWKRVLKEGKYPVTHRQPLTVVKDKLREMTPANAFRQFILIQDRFASLGLQKMTLTDLDLLREL